MITDMEDRPQVNALQPHIRSSVNTNQAGAKKSY
jgi:hypothetical protein